MDTAIGVAGDDHISQTAVNGAYTALQKALADFEASKISVNKSDIHKTFDEAEKLIGDAVVGDKEGQYFQKAIDNLKKAIDDANAVIGKPGVTADEIAKANADLQIG